MTKEEAENHKKQGNKLFAEHRYEDAIKEYSTAIIKDPTERIFQYNKVISDTRKAIELDSTMVKAYYLLGQALIEEKQHTEALNKLKIAYELAIQQKVKYVNDILQALLMARKRKWDDDEAVRLEHESELLRYVKGLVLEEKKRDLAQVGDDPERRDEIEYFADERLVHIQKVFEQSKENLMRREIPDAYLDKISFNIMHDPVFTPDGFTYERQSLLDHFARNGNFDPITGRPCSESALVPNRSLKEAIEDFLKDNGWAADY
ncbi:hypothetical protein BCR43DRAFT_207982 [Syncephalastrum racemosum]|uniref:E3 ubiquitin-protein ligase CHIP n=1 Tax=Syncephalastrum racemosum TaxID=13706 RepID=A0A1X2HI81_SYNRA|nr:hypothetical protein BCR43DRAFT_207982 [Syncephalastrum racemosum]